MRRSEKNLYYKIIEHDAKNICACCVYAFSQFGYWSVRVCAHAMHGEERKKKKNSILHGRAVSTREFSDGKRALRRPSTLFVVVVVVSCKAHTHTSSTQFIYYVYSSGRNSIRARMCAGVTNIFSFLFSLLRWLNSWCARTVIHCTGKTPIGGLIAEHTCTAHRMHTHTVAQSHVYIRRMLIRRSTTMATIRYQANPRNFACTPIKRKCRNKTNDQQQQQQMFMREGTATTTTTKKKERKQPTNKRLNEWTDELTRPSTVVGDHIYIILYVAGIHVNNI